MRACSGLVAQRSSRSRPQFLQSSRVVADSDEDESSSDRFWSWIWYIMGKILIRVACQTLAVLRSFGPHRVGGIDGRVGRVDGSCRVDGTSLVELMEELVLRTQPLSTW